MRQCGHDKHGRDVGPFQSWDTLKSRASWMLCTQIQCVYR